MTYDSARAYLFGLEVRGIKSDLERVRAAFVALGSPQRSYPSILVAGTNGKGSTSAALASSLAAAGLKVGLYTSPHLLDFRERIRLDGQLITEAEVARIVERDRATWERFELSFFEAATALAFASFREHAVDLAVLEVGMGGRLDATNTVEPMLSVITPLGLDHAHVLGSTRAAIAREKAGILRPNVPVVLADGRADSIRAVRSVAEELHAPVFLRREQLWVDSIRDAEDGVRAGTELVVRRRDPAHARFDLEAEPLRLFFPLRGRHQAQNAATAFLSLAVLRAFAPATLRLRERLTDRAIQAGFRRLRWPGRLERIAADAPLWFDVAHNREGAAVLARSLAGRARNLRLVTGMLQLKDHAGFFRELRRVSGEAFVAPLQAARAASVPTLAEAARASGFRVHECTSVAAALSAARRDSAPVLVAGSFHTLEEAYRALGAEPMERLWDDATTA